MTSGHATRRMVARGEQAIRLCSTMANNKDPRPLASIMYALANLLAHRREKRVKCLSLVLRRAGKKRKHARRFWWTVREKT